MHLTREQIEKMEAGPELDRLVSAEIFGIDVTPPKFSTDIAAAWRVVEKMTARNLMPCIFWHNPMERGWCWRGAIGGILPGDLDVEVDAPTAPLAICRVALLCVLEEHGRPDAAGKEK